MIKSNFLIEKAMTSARVHCRIHFCQELGIEVTDESSEVGEVSRMALRDLTAIIGLGGSVNLLVAFSFDLSLANRLFERETQGIVISADECQDFLLATVAETANTILGHCTADLSENGALIAMTPPALIEQAKILHRPRGTTFARLSFQTADGQLDIDFVLPMGAFDLNLDPVSCA